MNNFIKLRNNYEPEKIKFCFIFESPPSSGKYFYDPKGKTSELLFRSMMKVLFNKEFKTKHEGLSYFQKQGFYLIDPIYIPVDKISDKEADNLILKNYNNFKKDLIAKGLNKTPLILVKKNIFIILKDRLIKDGFNVLNKDEMIPFPMHYHYKSFEQKIKKFIK